jgi:DNA-binding NarL/FixJ family response regulator
MKVVVNTEKIRAEVGKPHRSSVPEFLTPKLLEVLVARLAGATTKELADSLGKHQHTVLHQMGIVRDLLKVDNDIELGYLAVERGWVVIDEGGGA